MGKKVRVGKQRKDKFYHLAKETGYRARSAFKLIQLNRKFHFLEKSRVLVDLCAAPGGWLQVARQFMPISSVVVGVDLVPIKPIPNVIALQEDITTDKCRQSLKKELKTWKADVVIHDGAPNVGKSWSHDAFIQARLTLSALKLATEFLLKGGWFVTKIFRSKDYQPIIWVLQKLFKKVQATKPQASRSESAEIFVVCQYYLAPDKIDSKFLDPSHVFEEVDQEPQPAKLNLLHGDKKKKKAEGYPEGETVLHTKVSASELVKSENFIEMLGSCNEIVIDDDRLKEHPLTTVEIVECFKDLKVLGKREFQAILKWRKKMKSLFEEEKEPEKMPDKGVEEMELEEDKEERQIREIEASRAQEMKKKKKKMLKEKRKVRDRINLKMQLKNDEPIIQQDMELFQLTDVKTSDQLEKLDENLSIAINDTAIVGEGEIPKISRNWEYYDRDETKDNEEDQNVEDEEGEESEELEFESDPEPNDSDGSDDSEVEESEKNPLLVKLSGDNKAMKEMWFENQELNSIVSDDDEDLELQLMSQKLSNKKSKNISKNDDQENGVGEKSLKERKADKEPKKRKLKLDPEGLALGSIMIKSKKAKRDVIDASFNRYTFNDDNLPDWFVKDEKKFNQKQVNVDEEILTEYKGKLREINARTIKKVAEAKARKKKRAVRKLEKARKKAEAVTSSADMSDREKAQNITAIYKKALQQKKKDVTYVVAKKGMSKRVSRPAGVKGRYKLVDKRLKKDNRGMKEKGKKSQKGKASKVPKRKKQ